MRQIKEKYTRWDLQFLCQQMLADKLEEYEATKEMSWIVDKGSEGILSQHTVNWQSLGLFGLKPLPSLMAVNANEHPVCSALYLESWGRHFAGFQHSYSFCQNSNLPYAQPFLVTDLSSYLQYVMCPSNFGKRYFGLLLATSQLQRISKTLALYTQWKTSASQAENSPLPSVL